MKQALSDILHTVMKRLDEQFLVPLCTLQKQLVNPKSMTPSIQATDKHRKLQIIEGTITQIKALQSDCQEYLMMAQAWNKPPTAKPVCKANETKAAETRFFSSSLTNLLVDQNKGETTPANSSNSLKRLMKE